MSPEQANGFPADRRSDIFSFGVVLYEMFTDRQPFQGRTTSEIMASVLVKEPDWTAMPSNLNPRIHELVRRCLQKDTKARCRRLAIFAWKSRTYSLVVELSPLHESPYTRVQFGSVQFRYSRLRLSVATIAAVAAWNLK